MNDIEYIILCWEVRKTAIKCEVAYKTTVQLKIAININNIRVLLE